MKKLLSLIIVLTLVLSMGVGVFAEETGGYEDWSPIKINKELTVQGVNPEETFNFTIGGGSGERDKVTIDAPDFPEGTFSITVPTIGADDVDGVVEASTNITLPDFTQVGVYTYPINEKVGDTAGFDYDGGTYYLVVTVINNPNYVEGETPKFLRVLTLTDENDVKDDEFKNSFNAGNLTVNKVITGNYADPNDVFEITVVVTPEEGKVINNSTITWNTEEVTEDEGVYTAVYKLKGGESFTIQNLPYDVDYKVVEAQATGYDAPQYDENKEGEMNAAAITTTITNNRDQEIATGINLDNLPYILILGAVTIGLFGFTMKRRFNK